MLACAACAPTVVPTESLTPSPLTFEISAELYLESEPYPLRSGGPIVVNGDERLAFRLEFHTQMDVGSVAAAIRSQLPEATAFRSVDDDNTVFFDVPEGSTPLSIDPRGARSLARPNIGIVGGVSWEVSRPGTTLSLYRPADLVAGSRQPAEKYRFAFSADPGLVRLDPNRRAALVSITRPQHLSFVELPSGTRTALPADLNKIGSNGAHMRWLADGRFLTLGSHTTVIGGPRGEDGRTLPTLPPGQSGLVSPNEKLVALASYPTDQAAIQDLETGELRSLGDEYRRCSAYASAALSWSPDGRTVSIGHCTLDMAGPGKTVFVDVATLRRVRSLDGWSVLAWLPNGTMLAHSWSDASGSYLREPDPAIAVLDPQGRVLRRFESPMPYGLSPDGQWIVDGGLDPQHPAMRLVDISSGRTYPLGISEGYPTWTADGLIAVLAKA